jgi:hypothetical protein
MAKRAVSEQRSKATGKAVPSAAEQAAREDMEALYGRPLIDEEWNRHSKRLAEFVRILSRWDAEQRSSPRCAKMESKPDQKWVA